VRGAYDVVVVGGGPGGLVAARYAAEGGASVLVVEKDPDIGVPVRCAEGVSRVSLREFYEPDPAFCRHEISEYHLVAPNGLRVTVAALADGYILDRRIFDRRVAEDAVRAGAQVITSANALGARRENGGVAIAIEGRGEVRAKIMVGADGVESRAGRWLGLRAVCRPRDMESAAQYLVCGVELVPHRLEMHFGSQVAPGGYFWVFPKGSDIANMGVGISGGHGAEHPALWYLDRMMERHWPHASIIGRTLGGIPCSGGLREIVGDNVVLVGDAAHQANPLTGGGIMTAMKAGRIAGRVVAEAVRAGDMSKRALEAYEREWNDLLGKVHRRFYRMKEGAFHLTDETINDLAATINNLPADSRTMSTILTRALIGHPRLILDLARIVF